MGLRGLKFYTVKEVAVIMQVRIETVLRWIYARKLKASKLPSSRIWRIREEDIIEFMEQGANINDDSLDVTSLEDEIEEQEEEVVVVATPKPVIREIEKNKARSNKPKRNNATKKNNDMTFDFSSSSRFGSKSSSIGIAEEIGQEFEEEVIEENILREEDIIREEEDIHEKTQYKSKDSFNNINNSGSMLFCDIDEEELNREDIETIGVF